MSAFRRIVGLDPIDLVIHVGVTLALMAWVAMSNGPEELLAVITGASLVVLGVRRSIALRSEVRRGLSSSEMAAERLAELEQRIEELEMAQVRVAELEERLDFAERMLAHRSEQRVLPEGDRP